MPDIRIHRLWELDPEFGHASWRTSPTQIERVLHVHLGTPEEPQASLCRALASLAATDGYRCVEWTVLDTLQKRHQAVVDAASQLRPTLIFLQLQRPNVLSPSTVAEARKAAGTHNLVVISWCGDVGGSNGPYRSHDDRWAYDMAVQCDLMLYSSMSQVRAHRSRAMHNAAYLQIGYDEDRYFEGPDDEYGSHFDVVFLGTKYHDTQRSVLTGQESGLRRVIAETMRSRLGERFGLFGHGWGGGVAHLPAGQSGDTYRRAHFALSISLCSVLERYSSDRLFRALACGTSVLLKAFDDWPSFGLQHGENLLVWESVDEAMALVDEWLNPARRSQLREIGRRGARLAREHHSWGIRMQELYPFVMVMRGVQPEVERPW
jgi:hypothetical protein